MDGTFFPAPDQENERAPGSAEVIHLRRALYVLKGQFFNPLTQEDAPLPPHRFALFQSPTVFSESGTSAADGLTGIFAPDLSAADPDAPWELMMIPVFPGRPDSLAYAERKHAWIDVETLEWLPPDDLDGNGRSFDALGVRKLLRINLWSTRRHAEAGLGFAQPNPHAPDFSTKGTLATAELKPHGSGSDPWIMQVDKDRARTFVRMRYYDFGRKQERSVPQGLILRVATPITVGGSSVRLEDGTIYMLHPTKDVHPDTEYGLRLQDGIRFSHKNGTMRRETAALQMDAIADDYALPPAWTSNGTQAWVGTEDASAGGRKAFSTIRTAGTSASQPLNFHLDDIVLRVGNNLTAPASRRAAVFDGLLALKNQATGPGGPLPYSTTALPADNPLPAEQWFYEAGKGLEGRTRLIEHEGIMFDIGESRVSGGSLSDPHHGSREAARIDGRNVNAASIAIVDCRYLDHTYGSTTGKLAHLLLYGSGFVNVVRPGANQNVQSKTESLLVRSAQDWTGSHPAFPGSDELKSYAFVPSAGFSDGDTVIIPRFHFGARTTPNGITSSAVQWNVFGEAGRATGSSSILNLFLRHGSNINPPANQNNPVVSTYAFAPDPDESTTDRYDDVAGERCTLTHELGHLLQLPDEYFEKLVPPAGLAGRLPRFEQDSPSKPYGIEPTPMMNGNKHNRLRYLWAWREMVDAANLSPEHVFNSDGPWDVIYQRGDKRLTYEIPETHASFPSGPHIWNNPLTFDAGRGHGHLYPMGDDEANRGPQFRPAGTGFLDALFDGVVVFVCQFWFAYEGTLTDQDDRWEALVKFGKEYFSRRDTPHFLIEYAKEDAFKRVAILVQPRFEFGPSQVPPNNTQTDASADIKIFVRNDDDPPTGSPPDIPAHPMEVHVRESEVGRWLMRFALDADHNGLERVDDPFTNSDFTDLNIALSVALGRTTGIIKAYE